MKNNWTDIRSAQALLPQSLATDDKWHHIYMTSLPSPFSQKKKRDLIWTSQENTFSWIPNFKGHLIQWLIPSMRNSWNLQFSSRCVHGLHIYRVNFLPGCREDTANTPVCGWNDLMPYTCCGPLSHQELLRVKCCGEHSYRNLVHGRDWRLGSSDRRRSSRGLVCVWSPGFMNEATACS